MKHKLTIEDINAIVGDEEANALNFVGDGSELAKNRALLMDYYNLKPYGDEIDGQSSVITSDVADIVEGMLPTLLKIFTQGKNIAVFEADRQEYDKEAEQKTVLANYVFLRQNNGVKILYDMLKDGLLQYTGACKVYWDDTPTKSRAEYENLSPVEVQLLLAQGGEIVEERSDDETGENEIVIETIESSGKVCIETIPPDELIVNRDARSFDTARFIGLRTPKRRSDLIKMGFSKKIVDSLPSDQAAYQSETSIARNANLFGITDNPTNHHPNDTIMLGEYYIQLDIDGDGITELYQVFRAGDQILEYEMVDTCPICVFVPIPIPHRAIGTCPAEQVADIQYTKSVLARQAQNNIYQTNFSRMLYNKNVNLDDLLTPRAGGVIGVDTDGPVSGSVEPIIVQPITGEILGAIEYWDSAKEQRTGFNRNNQGLDAESLNKTATGFMGLKDMSQQRMELIARLAASGAFEQIFNKIIENLSKYQDQTMQVKVSGRPMEIDPTAWKGKFNCRIDVGLGAGDRQEKIANLSYIFQQQKELMQMGYVIADQKKLYNTLNKVITEIGLKDVDYYFNDPEKPEEILQAQNEQMMLAISQMQANMQNPLVEAEQAKAQGRLMEQQAKLDQEAKIRIAELHQEQEQFKKQMMAKLTELELKYGQNVPGSSV